MDRGDYILSAYSGDVDIVCPAAASYELSAKTLKGKVINTMPMTHRRESASPLGTSNSLLGTRNAGKATVELTSFSGNIRIRPAVLIDGRWQVRRFLTCHLPPEEP